MTTINIHELTFITREQYITWRAAWRTEYANLMKAIRTLKNGIAEGSKNLLYTGNQQNRLISLRGDAVELLQLRARSKVIAGLLRDEKPLDEATIEALMTAKAERQKARAAINMTKALEKMKAKRGAKAADMTLKMKRPQIADAAD